jgi:23S rRNA (pseudouridine1915-N3)-methyltransferase
MPDWIEKGALEYKKRLRAFCDCNIYEIPHKDKINEAQAIKNHIPKGSRIFVLMIDGKIYSSEAFANYLAKTIMNNSNLCFIIGGPEGLDESIQNIAHETLSLSSFTLPHTLARVVLLEAIYRAFTINNNLPYHK